MDNQASRRSTTLPMSVERIEDLADRHGGQIAHWPRHEAIAARVFLATSSEARAVLARAERLDRILSATFAPAMSGNLRDLLLAGAPGGTWRDLVVALWPFGPVWRPAAALCAMAMMGVFLGSTEVARLNVPASVNAALSEEIRVVGLSAIDVLGDSNQWEE